MERRSQAPEWCKAIGIDIAEEVEDTGIVYYSRFFRVNEDQELPFSDRLIAGDLGYLKYGVFGVTIERFSITLAYFRQTKHFGEFVIRKCLIR